MYLGTGVRTESRKTKYTLKKRMIVILWRCLDACLFFLSEESVGGGERVGDWWGRRDCVLWERVEGGLQERGEIDCVCSEGSGWVWRGLTYKLGLRFGW